VLRRLRATKCFTVRTPIDSKAWRPAYSAAMRFLPNDESFFDQFEKHGRRTVDGCRALLELVTTPGDMVSRAKAISEIESDCDRITHAVVAQLHKTFITPLDRNDIHRLITKMDDILDLVEDTSQSIFLYDVQVITAEARRLADICVACGEKVKQAVGLLANMDDAQAIMQVCEDIDRLESEADHVMRDAMAKLFRDEPDVRQLIKLRTVYELLEGVTDTCEDVANIIEGIVLENS